MSEWSVVFLGVIALASLVQCGFVVVTALSLRDSAARINEFCQRFDAEIRPALDDLRKGAANLRAISDTGREQAARIEALLSTTFEQIETSIETARSLVAKPMATLSELSALWGGFRRGLSSLRRRHTRSLQSDGDWSHLQTRHKIFRDDGRDCADGRRQAGADRHG